MCGAMSILMAVAWAQASRRDRFYFQRSSFDFFTVTEFYRDRDRDYGWGVRVRRHLAHAGGVLYGMELGSVTLKINNQHTLGNSTHTREVEIPPI